MAKQRVQTVLLSILVLAVIVGIVGFLWMGMRAQNTAENTQNIITQETAKPSSTGKLSTLNVFSLDPQNNFAAVSAPLYLITSPKVSEDKSEVSGTFAADATTIGTTTRTAVTSGITVGTEAVAFAGNNSWISYPTDKFVVGTESKVDNSYQLSGQGQSQSLDLYSYATASNVLIQIKDSNENVISVAAGAGKNLTLGADDSEVIKELKIEVNNTNAAMNLAGFYFNLVANTNVSGILVNPGYSGSGAGTTDPAIKVASLGLRSTDNDDYLFLFDSPILLKERASLIMNSPLQFTTDSDGCNDAYDGEDISIYLLDRQWVKSSTDTKLIYAYESDAPSSADVGMTNPSFTFTCSDV